MNPKKPAVILTIVIVVSLVAGFFDIQPLWKKVSNFRPWSLGLDLAGGSLLTYEIDLSQIASKDRDSVAKGLRDVIERRINFSGVREPRIYLEEVGEHKRLVVELAGIKDVNEAKKEIGATPLLDFREVIQTNANATATESLQLNIDDESNFRKTALTGRYVKSAQLGFDNITGRAQVDIEFSEEGAKIFEELTEKNIGKPIAIFLDNQLIEMPVVREKIAGGKAQISGGFTIETARALVERFNAGALPAPIVLVNQETISAELGQTSLARAILAGIFGTLFIILFMIVFYRGFGVIASIALLMYIALTLAIFKITPVTLTLSGIAGFILSIGMAVDANILVFERTREELARGLKKNAAIEEGFRRAWTSIRDSNISTLITSGVLYYFTSSFVRGFALTLFVGVVLSMFSAITITRSMLRVFMEKEVEPKKN